MKILKEILKLSWVDDFNLFTIGFASAAVVIAFIGKQIINLCILVPLLLLTIYIRKVGGREKMGKYRKKPVVIEAIQYDGKNSADIFEFCGRPYDRYVREPVGNNYLEIITLEGVMKAQPGDYIIKGVKGEFYPCKPDIFEQTYEKIN